MLHVVRGLANSSGTTHIVGPLAEEQARLGCGVSVFHVRKGMQPAVEPDPALVESRCFELSLPLDNPGVSLGFQRAIDHEVHRFDVVHIHAIWNFPSWRTMRAAARAGIPYLVAPQGSLDPWAMGQNPVGKKLYGAVTEIPLMRRAARLQALTQKEAGQFRAFGLDTAATVIPNGVDRQMLDLERSRNPGWFGLPDRCLTLLFLSRVHPKKGLDMLVDAVAAVLRDLPDLRIVVAGGDAGSGYLEHVKTRCSRHGVSESFVFPGELAGEQKTRALCAADAFILPSYSEGLPVAVLEAMAAGLPVIVTDQCNLPEIGEREAGCVVPPETERIGEAIAALFSLEQEQRERMGRQGRELVSSKFTWERIAASTLECYREIASAGR